jgi:threonine/homoserine/homoserine lactone efflux protein
LALGSALRRAQVMASSALVFDKLTAVERWVRRLAGGLFVLAGVYYCVTHIYGIHF